MGQETSVGAEFRAGRGQRLGRSIRSLLICLAILGVATAPGQRKLSKKMLRTDLARVHRAKASATKKLRDTKARVKIVVGDIAEVDKKLTTIEDALDRTTRRLDASRAEQTKLAAELKAAEEELKRKGLEVARRLRQAYVNGEESMVAELVASRSLGELADRRYILERMAAFDRKLFGEFRALRAKVAREKRRADQLVAEIAQLAESQQAQQAEMQGYRQAKQDALNDLKNQQGKLEQVIAELDAEESSIEARINAYNRNPAVPKLPPFTGRFMRPVNAAMGARRFGMRLHPILRIMRMHNGIDFSASFGKPIFSAADGVVISASYSRGFGNHVIIDHGGGISTLYAHASRLMARNGQRVRRGQQIAAVGSTGLSTGPHLHWEVRVNGKAVNPMGRL